MKYLCLLLTLLLIIFSFTLNCDVFDAKKVTVTDTIPISDTMVQKVFKIKNDTVINKIYDTVIKTTNIDTFITIDSTEVDTIFKYDTLIIYDTSFKHDTIFKYDTIFKHDTTISKMMVNFPFTNMSNKNVAKDGKKSTSFFMNEYMMPTYDRFGKDSCAIMFHDTNSYSYLNFGPIMAEHSISLWLKIEDYNNTYEILRTETKNTVNFNIRWDSDKKQLQVFTQKKMTWTPLIVFDDWIHIVYTREDGMDKLYINGRFRYDGKNSDIKNDFLFFKMGNKHANEFRGAVDDIRIFNKTLSSVAIKYLYKLGK